MMMMMMMRRRRRRRGFLFVHISPAVSKTYSIWRKARGSAVA
jgi:hypothetical protein